MTDQGTSLSLVLESAIAEIQGLYQRALTTAIVKDWRVSDSTDSLLQFRRQYSARLTANAAIGSTEELRWQLMDDLRGWLNMLFAFKDYVDATQVTEVGQINIMAAQERYFIRSRALEVILNALFGAHAPLDSVESIESARSELYKSCKGESERKIFQLVSRIAPSASELDEEITAILYLLIQQAHKEPAIGKLVTAANSLISPTRIPTQLRALAASQELRDYVAPYLSALIKKALSPEGVEAFDDAFRNTYFAVVNRVINYYQTFRPEAGADMGKGLGVKGEEPAGALETVGGDNASRLTPHASPKTQSDTPSPQSTSVQDQADTSVNATPMPPFDEPEPAGVKSLLSSSDVEAITHESLDSLDDSSTTKKSPKKVIGTGLE